MKNLLTLAPGECSVPRIVIIIRQIIQWINNLVSRTSVTTPLTIYVSNAGSDSNDGLSAGTPFLKIQTAVDYVCNNLDIRNSLVKIKLADGTYTETVILRDYIGPFFPTQITNRASATEPRIEGNLVTPANVVVDGSGVTGQAFFAASVLMPWFIDGITVIGGIFVDYASLVNVGTITFGASTANSHIVARYGSRVEIIAGSTITVTAGSKAFADALEGAIILSQGGAAAVTGVMSGTPNFTDAYAKINDQSSVVDLGSISWSGAATGIRAYINGGSSGGADPTTYPGNSAPVYDILFLGKAVVPDVNGGTGLATLKYKVPTSWTPADASGASLTLTNNNSSFALMGTIFAVQFDITYPITANGNTAAISLPSGISPSLEADSAYFPVISSGATQLYATFTATSINFASSIVSGGTLATNAVLSAQRLKCMLPGY